MQVLVQEVWSGVEGPADHATSHRTFSFVDISQDLNYLQRRYSVPLAQASAPHVTDADLASARS